MDSEGCRWLLTGFSVLTGFDTFWGSACSQAPDAIWAFLSMYCIITSHFFARSLIGPSIPILVVFKISAGTP